MLELDDGVFINRHRIVSVRDRGAQYGTERYEVWLVNGVRYHFSSSDTFKEIIRG